MTTNDEIRKFAESIDTDELPRDGVYYVAAARPQSSTEAVTDLIEGRYHALYARDRIAEEMGYMGVSFHIERADDQ